MLFRSYFVYAHNNRYYKLSLDPSGTLPEPELWTSLKVDGTCFSQVGGYTGAMNDFEVVERSLAIEMTPGPDAICDTDDDVYVALRLSMTATDTPVPVARPLWWITTDSGRLEGFVSQSGRDLRFINAALTASTPYFQLESASPLVRYIAFGAGTDAHWIFLDGRRLIGAHLNPSAPTPTTLIELGDTEELGWVFNADSTHLYFTITSPGKVKIMRVDRTLTLNLVAELEGGRDYLELTDSRVIAATEQGLLSLPKTGGAAVEIMQFDSNFTLLHVSSVHETLYVSGIKTTTQYPIGTQVRVEIGRAHV